MTELSDLSKRNDELMTAKDADLVVIRDLDAQLKEYKRKYEQAKTELRSMKGKSSSYLLVPRIDATLYSHISAIFATTQDGRPVASLRRRWST